VSPFGEKIPIQRRADIVDAASLIGQPFGHRPRLPLALGPLEQIPVVFGMAPRHLFELAGLGKLIERVSAHRLEQPIIHRRAGAIRNDERFLDQVRNMVDPSDAAISALATTVIAASRVKLPGKTARRRRTARSWLGEQLVAPVECGPKRLLPRATPCGGPQSTA